MGKSGGGAKENNGKAAARRKQQRCLLYTIMIVTFICTCFLSTIKNPSWSIWILLKQRIPKIRFHKQQQQQQQQQQQHGHNSLVLENEGHVQKQQQRLRNKNYGKVQHSNIVRHHRLNNNGDDIVLYDSPPPIEILSGYLNLIDLKIRTSELSESTKSKSTTDNDNTLIKYKGVYAIFCRLDWQLHKDDPSSVPMFRDIIGHSIECDETRTHSYPLYELVTDVRKYDSENKNSNNNNNNNNENDTEEDHEDNNNSNRHVAKVLDVKGFTFHESRCGSTLVANLLSAANPIQHRVYSESGPPIEALKICGEQNEYCTSDVAATIFRDVIYLMSRSDNYSETSVFFKIQSIGSRQINVFQKAYPTTPWIFVYRDPVQVMMSHLKTISTSNSRSNAILNANCVRPQRNPPLIVQELVHKYNTGTSTIQAENIRPEEYCAVHLASLTESIVNHYYSSTSTTATTTTTTNNNNTAVTFGKVINYSSLPDILYTTIFPKHFGIVIDETSIEYMKVTATKYSKGRGTNTGEFHNDNIQKEQNANSIVKNAAMQYLQPSYIELEKLASINTIK